MLVVCLACKTPRFGFAWLVLCAFLLRKVRKEVEILVAFKMQVDIDDNGSSACPVLPLMSRCRFQCAPFPNQPLTGGDRATCITKTARVMNNASVKCLCRISNLQTRDLQVTLGQPTQFYMVRLSGTRPAATTKRVVGSTTASLC
uniref:Secreted protein n=1 Tax=Ixodes ricinus TaxID=34613 RepID=A0A6B0UUN5_IXORI